MEFGKGLKNPVSMIVRVENFLKKEEKKQGETDRKKSPGEGSTGSVEFKYCMCQSPSKRTRSKVLQWYMSGWGLWKTVKRVVPGLSKAWAATEWQQRINRYTYIQDNIHTHPYFLPREVSDTVGIPQNSDMAIRF